MKSTSAENVFFDDQATRAMGAAFDEAIYTSTQPLTSSAISANAVHFSSRNDKPVHNAKSDHGRRKFYDEDGEFPIPPPRKWFRRSAKVVRNAH